MWNWNTSCIIALNLREMICAFESEKLLLTALWKPCKMLYAFCHFCHLRQKEERNFRNRAEFFFPGFFLVKANFSCFISVDNPNSLPIRMFNSAIMNPNVNSSLLRIHKLLHHFRTSVVKAKGSKNFFFQWMTYVNYIKSLFSSTSFNFLSSRFRSL